MVGIHHQPFGDSNSLFEINLKQKDSNKPKNNYSLCSVEQTQKTKKDLVAVGDG
jgi:hypothetical protein